MGSSWFGLALACAFSLGAPAAGGEPAAAAPRYSLRWVIADGAESCVSGATLARLLDQVLGPVSVTPDARVSLEGEAKPAAPPFRFSLHVAVRDPESTELLGERELTTADSCAALTPALLLVLAMSVDPTAARDGLPESVKRALMEPQPASPPEPRSQPVPLSAPRLPVPIVRKSTALPALSAPPPAQIYAALAGSLAVLPSLAMGAGLGGRLPLRRGWELSLGAWGWAPQTVLLPDSPYLLEDGGVDIAAAQISLGLCRPLWRRSIATLSPCGGMGGGLRWVSARALANKDNPIVPFYGPEVGAEFVLRPGDSWFVGAGLMAQVQLRRDRLTYRDRDQKTHVWFEPAPVSARAWLSFGALL